MNRPVKEKQKPLPAMTAKERFLSLKKRLTLLLGPGSQPARSVAPDMNTIANHRRACPTQS